MRRSGLLLSILILGFSVVGFAEERLLWNQVVSIQPGQYVYLPVSVPIPLVNGRIAGSFQAAGGAGNEITFTVLSGEDFRAYSAGGRYASAYTAERKRSDVISVPLRNTGIYYLVFDNRFSLLANKQVRVELRLVYDSEDRARAAELAKQEQERLKRIGMILGKLTEVLQAREQRLGTHQINPPIRFGIIEDKTINAFAQPNRQIIALNRGLIDFAESAGTPELVDAVLAGVLGHELAHIFYRHSSGNIQAQGVQAAGVGGAAGYFVHPLVGLIAGALVLDQQKAYDRMEEREADMLGIQLACEAGFDPTGLLILLQRMARDSNSVDFLQSHPSPQSRDEYLKSAAINCLRPEPATPKSTSNFSEPMVVYKADPAYTASARRAGVRGTLTVQAMIGVDGRAREITVLKGLGYGLEEEAIRTIETLWRFAPAKKDGVLIPSPMQINVVFQP